MGDVCKPYVSPAREDVFKMRVRLAVWNVSGALGKSWILWHVWIVQECFGRLWQLLECFGRLWQLCGRFWQVLAQKMGTDVYLLPTLLLFNRIR
jgi:hypothetical protein